MELRPRIEWGPDGARVLIVDRGAIQIRSLDGTLVRELEPRSIRLGSAPRGEEPFATVSVGFLDARWLRDGRIVAVDTFGMPVQFSMHGQQYGDPVSPPNPWRRDFVQLAATGSVFLVVDLTYPEGRLSVCSTSPDHPEIWWLMNHRRWYPVKIDVRTASAVLAPDGNQVAIGWPSRHDGVRAGREWIVLDIVPRPFELSGTWGAPVIDHRWFPVDPTDAPMSFAFDRSGRRLAITSSEPAGVSGTIRLGMPAGPATFGRGGARCVALDDHGIRAAYVYPPGIGEQPLRVDYLTPKPKGARVVETVDVKWIDPGVDVAAIAFDAEGHRIACLGVDGTIEIVPVP